MNNYYHNEVWMNNIVEFILDFTGIDVIQYALWKKVEINPLHKDDYSTNINLLSEDRIDFGLVSSEKILLREDDRRIIFEKKAESILGMTGITTAFIVGFVNLILNKLSESTTTAAIIVVIIFVFTLVSLILSILLAFKVIKVGEYVYSNPGVNTIYSDVSINVLGIKRKRFIENNLCYYKNREINNIKGSLISWAHIWFRNGLFLLFILTLVTLLVFTKQPTKNSISEVNLTNNSIIFEKNDSLQPNCNEFVQSQTPNLLPTLISSTIEPTITVSKTISVTNTPEPQKQK
ncbi:MAG: hypothetical protein C0412_16570 [Flavobacterium sp.]|nr:hypothetical protein [Flavobacterium sp.]